MINSREHSSQSFSAPSNFPIFTFFPQHTTTDTHQMPFGKCRRWGTQQLFAVILSIFFIFMTKRWVLCTGLAIHSFIHSGQRTEFAPIWETEINEKPRVLLILTTFALTPWALSFTRGRNWRIGGVAAKQNLIAKPIPLFYITVDAHYSRRQSAFCHCFCGSLNFSFSFIIRAKLAGSCPTIEMYLSDLKTFVMAALLI